MAAVLAAGLALLAFQDPRALAERLSSDDVAARDQAALDLRRAGRAAWPLLERAARSADPEAAGRARDLLDAVRVRRRLTWRMIDACPGLEAALRGGTSSSRAAAARALAGFPDEGRELLLELLRDADAETALAAAESLHETHSGREWVPRMLDLLASPAPPRPRTVAELLSSARASLTADDLRARFDGAAPAGRSRLLELSASVQSAFPIDAAEILDLLAAPRARAGAVEWIAAFGRREFAVALEERLVPAAPDAADLLCALRRLSHPVAPERLLPLLEHDDEGVREQAVQAIPEDRDPSIDAALARLLDDPSTSVRQRAVAAYARRLGDAARGRILEFYLAQDGDPRDAAAFLLCRSREWTAPRARELLHDRDAVRRLRGAELLHRLDGLDAVRGLAEDPDEGVRRWILTKAGSAGDDDAASILRTLAADASASVRFDAVRALARGGRREDIEALVPWLDSAEFTVRHQATEAYIRHGGAKARDLMTRLLDDSDASMRCVGLAALQDRASPEAAERALPFLDDPDASLRRAAGSYLEQAAAGTRDPSLLAAVAGRLDRLEGETLAQAARIITSHGAPAHAPAVRRLLAEGRAPHEGRALDALARWEGASALLECLTPARCDAVLDRLAAARPHGPAVAERVRALAAHPTVAVRRSVARHAADLAMPDAASLLLGDPDAGVRCLAIASARRLGVAIPAPLLDDEDADVRLAAAQGIGDPAAVERMLALEECAWVRQRLAKDQRSQTKDQR